MSALDELVKKARDWTARELGPPQPKIVFLRGPMGAGKTTFVTKVAEALGATDAASPSFALHNRYDGLRGSIDHFDLDRLVSREDLESTGFWDIIADAARAQAAGEQRFVMIEWASRLEEFGVGSEGARWTAPFRTWSFDFSGAPMWEVAAKLR